VLSDIEITHRALLALRATHELRDDPAAMRRRAQAVLFDLDTMDLVRVTAELALLAVTPRPERHAADRAAIQRWLDMMEGNLALMDDK